MASCEKCWTDSHGDPERYRQLIAERNTTGPGPMCTPEEMAGPYATDCPQCKTQTVHQWAHQCMRCGWVKPAT